MLYAMNSINNGHMCILYICMYTCATVPQAVCVAVCECDVFSVCIDCNHPLCPPPLHAHFLCNILYHMNSVL